MAKIKNINGTSDNKCKCGTWIDHWKKYNIQRQTLPIFCPTKGCLEKPTVGAHVQKDSFLDNSWYIVPLCVSCNKSASPLEIADYISLAPANKATTCK